MNKFYSQHKQDEYVYNNFFKDKKESGTFLDIGANDGIAISNTYFFEKELGWKGMCVEPYKKKYDDLIKNRNCICINGCIADFNGKGIFLEIDGYPSMLSGLINKYDERHLKRIDYEIALFGGSKKETEVDCFIINDLLEENKLYNIDYTSIDVEGPELDILKTIDFDKFNFNVFSIENNYRTNAIKSFMKEKGFVLIDILDCDEIYIKKHDE